MTRDAMPADMRQWLTDHVPAVDAGELGSDPPGNATMPDMAAVECEGTRERDIPSSPGALPAEH